MPIIGWKSKLLGVGFVALTAFYAGWKVRSWHQSAVHEKEIKSIIEAKAKSDDANRAIIADLQAKKQEVITKEVIRYAKIKEFTDDRVCFANWGAVRMWNDALSRSQSVPKNTTRTAGASNGPSITDAQILENLNTNAARWEQLREQMWKIIEWDKKTFEQSE